MLLQFNYKISAYQLYKELNRIATFKLPTATPFLTALNQTRRRDHAEYLLASNIEIGYFQTSAGFNFFGIKKKVGLGKVDV